MTVFVDFVPVPTGAFQFRATLDGSVYNCTVTWNIYRQDWYINVFEMNGTRVFTQPLVPSPPHVQLERLTVTYAIASMTWVATGGGLLFVVASEPVPFTLGQVVNIAGATNTGSGGDSIVNGDFTINALSDSTHFTLYAPAGPGVIDTIGGTIVAAANTNALTWALGKVWASVGVPLTYRLGDIVKYTINDCVPAAYNGTYECAVTSETTFSYELTPDPGPATTLGTVSQDINLLAGYFSTSTMVWRDANQQFEIRP